MSTPKLSLTNVIKYGPDQELKFQLENYILLFLSPPENNELSNETDCVGFSYPKIIENAENCKVLKLKGMFLSLSQIMKDVAQQPPNMCSISINDKNEDKKFSVGFFSESRNTLVVILPEDSCITQSQTHQFTSAIAHVVKFLFKKLESAFERAENYAVLYNLFSVIDFLLHEAKCDLEQLLYVSLIERLFVDEDLSLEISEILSEFEAMDWLSEASGESSINESLLDFIVIGSCLIYKNYLITSHLPGSHLRNVIEFLRFRGLLLLNRSQSMRVVIWQEVYPSEFDNENSSEEATVRHFLLVVGFEHTLHCVMIEMPFSACNNSSIFPNQVIVSESIRFTKYYIRQNGLIEEIENVLRTQKSNLFGNFLRNDTLYKSFTSLKDLLSPSKLNVKESSSSSLSLTASLDVPNPHKSLSSPSLHRSPSYTTGSSSSTNLYPSFIDNALTSFSKEPRRFSQFKFCDNLLYFMEINDGLQMLYAPAAKTAYHSELFPEFRKCCLFISEQIKSSRGEIADVVLSISFSQKKASNLLFKKSFDNCIWVIGRIDAILGECYGCFYLKQYEDFVTDFNEIAKILKFYRCIV